jgi:hypothetical protein
MVQTFLDKLEQTSSSFPRIYIRLYLTTQTRPVHVRLEITKTHKGSQILQRRGAAAAFKRDVLRQGVWRNWLCIDVIWRVRISIRNNLDFLFNAWPWRRIESSVYKGRIGGREVSQKVREKVWRMKIRINMCVVKWSVYVCGRKEKVKTNVLLVAAPCSLTEIYRRFIVASCMRALRPHDEM